MNMKKKEVRDQKGQNIQTNVIENIDQKILKDYVNGTDKEIKKIN